MNLFPESNRDVPIDVQAILNTRPSLGSPTATTPRTPVTSGLANVWLQTAALALFASIGFLGGAVFYANWNTSSIEEQVAIAVDKIQARNTADNTSTVMNKNEFEKRLTEIRDAIAKSESIATRQHLRSLQKIGEQFESVFGEQDALRRDLQTLAVNAEEKINLTEQDIIRINEYVSAFLTIPQ